MTADISAVLRAPAKVNLSLRITGRRADGYHLLDSVVAFTTFGDTLSAVPSDSISLTVTGPFAAAVPTDGGNLVLKAAHALATHFGIRDGAAITLTKDLPAAGGIGGGSADAAVTLRLLCGLWDIDPAHPDLPGLALALGADVPVCLAGKACRMAGIGETLIPLPPLPSLGILLVNPGQPCPTPAVFQARNAAFSDPAPDFPVAPDAATFLDYLASEPNDLTEPALTVCPEIGTVLTALSALPGCRLSRMSGSGATCFALFDTPDAARRAVESIDAPKNWWVLSGGLLA